MEVNSRQGVDGQREPLNQLREGAIEAKSRRETYTRNGSDLELIKLVERTEAFAKQAVAHCEAIDANFRRREEFFAMMKVKYRRAAHRPWLQVAPDLPEPAIDFDLLTATTLPEP